jgi:hypothetical protein
MSSGLGDRNCTIPCANPCFRSKLVRVEPSTDRKSHSCRTPLRECHGTFAQRVSKTEVPNELTVAAQ